MLVNPFLLLVFLTFLFFLGYHFYLISRPQLYTTSTFFTLFFNNNTKAALLLPPLIYFLSILGAIIFGYYFLIIVPLLLLLNLWLKSPSLVYFIHFFVLIRLLWFFTPFEEIVLMTSFYRSFSCVFSLFAYLFFIYHHKVLILWASGLLRFLFVAGTGEVSFVFAGGGITLFKSINLSALEKDFSTYNLPTKKNTFFDYVPSNRIPGRTNEVLVEQNRKEYFPSYALQFYKKTYLDNIHTLSQKNSQAVIAYNMEVLKNFKGLQGSVFTDLYSITKETLRYYKINPNNLDYQRDAFYHMSFKRSGWMLADIPYLENRSEYNFNSELLGILSTVHSHLGYDVATTYQRGYGSFDGIIEWKGKKYNIDYYSPFSPKHLDDIYIEEKKEKGTDLIIINNFRDDFSAFSRSNILGATGNDLSLVKGIVRDVNKDVIIHTAKYNESFSLNIPEGYTTSWDSFINEVENK